MNKTLVLLLLGLAILLVVVGLVALRPGAREQTVPIATAPVPVADDRADAPPPVVTTRPTPVPAVSFGTPNKSAHFESSTPAHGTLLAAPPVNVVIDVNFDLTAPSSISITSGGKEYGVGATTIDANKLAMRRAVDAAAPDGYYLVKYTACWPDKSCHHGQFEFAVDRTQVSSAMDLRGTTAVTVDLKDIAFHPAVIRVSRGATITWTNRDAVEHYINTDAHPSHTYFPEQNSRVLTTGATYATAFRTPGAYPYHCSAHADVMRGMILVE